MKLRQRVVQTSSNSPLPSSFSGKTTHDILKTWLSVCGYIVQRNLDLFDEVEKLMGPPAKKKPAKKALESLLRFLKGSLVFQTHTSKIFLAHLKFLGVTVDTEEIDLQIYQALSKYQVSISKSTDKNPMEPHFEHLHRAHKVCFPTSDPFLPRFLEACVSRNIEKVPFQVISSWYTLFGTFWTLTHGKPLKGLLNQSGPKLATHSSFSKLLLDKNFQEYVTSGKLTMLESLCGTQIACIQQFADGDGDGDGNGTKRKNTPNGSKISRPPKKIRGKATLDTYGTWDFKKERLISKRNPDHIVRVLKCPYCPHDTTPTYHCIEDSIAHPVNPNDITLVGMSSEDDPIVDILKSRPSEALLHNRPFQNFRQHVRKCRKQIEINAGKKFEGKELTDHQAFYRDPNLEQNVTCSP